MRHFHLNFSNHAGLPLMKFCKISNCRRRTDAGRPGSSSTRRAIFGFAVAALLPIAGCSSSQNVNQQSLEGKQPDGFVDMEQVQAAFIGSGGGGSGTLTFRGQTYPFAVGGLGIGGIGASTIDASGEVYGLKTLADFPGAYAQGRYGFAIGERKCGRSLAPKRTRRYHAPQSEADRADVEPGRRCRCDLNAMTRPTPSRAQAPPGSLA